MTVNLVLSDGDILLDVPKNAFIPDSEKNRWLWEIPWYSKYVVWIEPKHKK
jgi:hypothetical protein